MCPHGFSAWWFCLACWYRVRDEIVKIEAAE